MSVKTFKEGIALDPQSSDPGSPKEGQFQQSDGTARTQGPWVYSGAAWNKLATGTVGSISVSTKTTTYTLSTTDDLILADGTSGAFTLTLPTAVGNTGKLFKMKKIDSSVNAITIDGDGSETMDGATTRALSTQYESLDIVSDGSNWVITEHYYDGKVFDDGALTITGTTSNPVKGTTSVDRALYRRDGRDLVVQIEYTQSGAGTQGSGDYLIEIPNSLTVDTSFVTGHTTVLGSGAWTTRSVLGAAAIGSSAADSNVGIVSLYDSTHIRIGLVNLGAQSMWSSATSPDFDSGSIYITAEFRVPISGWEA